MKLEFQVERIALGVTEQNMKLLGNNEIVGDSKNYIYAHFRLPNEWKKLTKQVYFNQSATSLYFVLTADSNNSVLIPHELMDHAGEFTISLVGTDDNKRITTNQCVVYVRGSGVIPPDNPNVPTIDFLTESVETVARDRQAVAEDTAHVNEVATVLYQEITEKLDEAIETASTNTAENITTKVQGLMNDSVATVNASKTTAVNTINSAKETAESVIAAAKEETITTVTNIKDTAVNKITSDSTKAVSDIELAKTTAEATIISLKADALARITGAGNSTINSINNLKTETLDSIYKDKEDALKEIDDSKNAAVYSVARQQNEVREELNTKVAQARSEANRAEQEANRATDKANAAQQIANELPERINQYVGDHAEELKGDVGPTGPQGPTGPAGRDGVDGIDGKDGKDGEVSRAELDEAKSELSDEIVALQTELTTQQKINKQQQREIELLKDFTEGIAWRSEIDTEESYTKTIPSGAKALSVNSIGGKCIVENQLNALLTKSGTNGGVSWTLDDNGWYSVNGNSTSISSRRLINDGVLILNHKIYAKIETVDVDGYTTPTLQFYPNSTRYSSSFIYTVSADNIYARVSVTSGVSTNGGKIRVQLFDLTQMFGADNEPTAEEFEQMFPNYIPYTEPTIKTICCDSVEVKGKNLWDEQWRVGGAENNLILSKNYNECKPNTNYFLVYTNAPSNSKYWVSIGFFDSEYQRIGSVIWSANMSVTSPANAKYFQISTNSSTCIYGNVYKNDIALVEGTSGTYSPYNVQQIPIPSTIQNLEGYGWSAGDVYNEVDYANKQYIQRVTMVDLGTLNWTRFESFKTWQTNGLLNKKYANETPMLLAGYTNVPYTAFTADKTVNKVVSNNLSNILFVRNEDYASANDFKQAMQGVYLYYELKVPIITDITDLMGDFDNTVLCEGNGTITFKNTLGEDYRVPIPNEVEYAIKVGDAL